MVDDNRLSSWIGRSVLGRDGEDIGTVVDVYVDDATGQPEWLAVKTGRKGDPVGFVPLAGAGVRDENVVVGYDTERVTTAPSADPDGVLTVDEEAMLYAHYGLEYSTHDSASGLPRQPGAVEARPAGPRMRRRRSDEDFEWERLPSEDVDIVVKRRSAPDAG